jgi:hypothetical protein
MPVVKPLKKNAQAPSHISDLDNKKRGDWEENVFDNAVLFTSTRVRGFGQDNDRREFKDFEDALRDAWDDDKAMVYAIAESGHNFCIAPKEWPKYALRWRDKKGGDATPALRALAKAVKTEQEAKPKKKPRIQA